MSDIVNPGWLSVKMHEFFWFVLSKKVYTEYVGRMQLEGNEKLLDFGCGPGAAAIHIAPILKKGGGELTCYDLSQTWIERAQRRLKKYDNVRFASGEIKESALEDDYFNAVNIHFMLHDIPAGDRLEALKVIASKLKDDGRLFIREPIGEDHGISVDQIRQLLEAAGFREKKSLPQTVFGRETFTAEFVKE